MRYNWPTKILGELEDEGVIKLGRGNVISKKDLLENPGDYPVYSASRLNQGEFGRYGRYMFDEELITWSIDGGGNFFYRPKHKFSVTNVCGWLRILKPEVLDYKYLYFALDLIHKRLYFDYIFKAHPSVIRDKYEIPLPPLEIQKRIVARIEELFEKIDKAQQLREKVLEETEEIFQSALQEIFSKAEKIYETREFIKCIEKPPKQIKGIPKGEYQKLGKFPIIDQGEVLIGGYTNDESKIYKGKLPVIIFGDHTRIFKYIDFPFAIGADGTKIIIPKEEINPKFFYYSLKSLDIESLGYSRHYKVLKIKKIPIPPFSKQKKIVAYLEDLREKIEKLKQLQQKQLEELTELKNSILEKAFKGELI
jgi:restriction endonuclease S subunit